MEKNASPCLTQKAPYKGPGADSEEKREPASDIDTAEVDSLKVLDPEWPIREADIVCAMPQFQIGDRTVSPREGEAFLDFPRPRSRTSHQASLQRSSARSNVRGRRREVQERPNLRCLARWRSDWRATHRGTVLRSID